MLRRLYFLFPDEMHAQRVVSQLIYMDVPESRFHAISRVAEVESFVHYHHPEAAFGGVSCSVDAFGI